MKIIRTDCWIDPCFDELIRNDGEASIEVLQRTDPDDVNWAKLMQADTYHVSAARDEVPLRWHVTDELVRRCPALKVVSSSGAGYDTIDVGACTRAGILVVNQTGGNARSVAEHTLGLMLSAAHRIAESDRMLRDGAKVSREDLMGHQLAGKTLGIVGIGHIGTHVARLGAALDMRIIARDPYVADPVIRERGAAPVPLAELLAQADVVSLHCPRTPETLGLFGQTVLQSMKKGSLFISTARGGIHDETALYRLLVEKHLAGAGLDVWMAEPPPADHPLLSLPNVVATYHTAGVTCEARHDVACMAAEQILSIGRGARPARIVNPQVCEMASCRLAGRAGF
ncbi:Formate dehydrogenase, mitochondrial [Castellaniella defragrans]